MQVHLKNDRSISMTALFDWLRFEPNPFYHQSLESFNIIVKKSIHSSEL